MKNCLKKQVYEYLRRKPGTTLDVLRRKFPEANRQTIKVYRNNFKFGYAEPTELYDLLYKLYRIMEKRFTMHTQLDVNERNVMDKIEYKLGIKK